MSDAQARLQALSEDFQKLQQGTSTSLSMNLYCMVLTIVWSRTSERSGITTEAWRTEAGECWCAAGKSQTSLNSGTPYSHSTQEFDRLQEGETIYKLSGPVLLKQDKIEAESTVKGRLDFIGGEM